MYTLEQMSSYLSKLGGYLGSYVLPDFSDLHDAIGEAFVESSQEFADDRARALEEAVARYNEEQRLKREAEAAERQLRERQALIDAALQQQRELPALPPAQALLLLPEGAATPAVEQLAAAQRDIDGWARAIAAPADEFERLRLAAAAALAEARRLLELLPGLVSAELGRRRPAGPRLASEGQAVLRELKPDWTGLSTKAGSVKNLKAAMQEHEQAALALQGLLAAGAPGEFDAAVRRVETVLQELVGRIRTVNSVLTTKEQEGAEALRQQQLGKLRWQRYPPLLGERLSVLAGEPLLEAYDIARQRYGEAFGRAESAKGDAFAEAHGLAQTAFEQLDLAYDKAIAAYEAAIKERKRVRAELREQMNLLQEARPQPLPGTDEAGDWARARQDAELGLGKLAAASDAATPEVFGRALETARAQMRTATEVHGRATVATRQRLEQVRVQTERLAAAVATARSGLPAGPSAEVARAVADALGRAADEAQRRIEGKNEELDRASVDGFISGAAAALTKLALYLKPIKPLAFAAVEVNAAVRAEIDKLLALLRGAEGLSIAAANQADTLKNKVHRVAESYALIADLLARHGDILAHTRFDLAWRSEVNPFIEFERNKDAKLQDALSKGINDYTGIFGEIEARMRKRERTDLANAAYANSYEGKFIEFWDDYGRGAAITELGRLVGLGKASEGEIKRCYLAGDDDESQEEFSVEISVDIDGRHGVVVHAHCDGFGVPKAGHACHFKLANNKREGGNSCTLDAALRAALLPSAGDILSDRSRKWEGRRPDYV